MQILNPSNSRGLENRLDIEQLVVLSNMDGINAVFINQGISQSQRLLELNKMAITQMKSLLNSPTIRKLK